MRIMGDGCLHTRCLPACRTTTTEISYEDYAEFRIRGRAITSAMWHAGVELGEEGLAQFFSCKGSVNP